jgi:hypothetical protein
MPYTLEQLRKYDLANLNRQQVETQMILMLGERTDLSLVGRYQKDEYPDTTYGLTEQSRGSIQGEISIQPLPLVTAHLFGGYERRNRSMQTIAGAFVFMSPDPDAGGPNYPLANLWNSDSKLDSYSAGAGFSAHLGPLQLIADYTFQRTVDRVGYAYASAGAIADDGGTPPTPGFPELLLQDQILETQAVLRISDPVSVRLLYRYQNSTIADYQQTGLPLVSGNRLFLGHIDGDYSAHVIAGALQIRFQ